METPELSNEVQALRDEVRALKERVERPRRSRFWWLVVALALSSTLAFADLIPFVPDQPAFAADVNANFQQLKTWLEAKTGLVTQAGITTPSLSVGSGATLASLTTNASSQLVVGGGGLALADNTGITSTRFGVAASVPNASTNTFNGGFLEGTFVDAGGTLVIMASATGWCSTPGRITMNVKVDTVTVGAMRVTCNTVSSHMAFPAFFLRFNRNVLPSVTLPATRTVRLEPVACPPGQCAAGLVTTNADVNDFGEVTVLRLPTP